MTDPDIMFTRIVSIVLTVIALYYARAVGQQDSSPELQRAKLETSMFWVLSMALIVQLYIAFRLGAEML